MEKKKDQPPDNGRCQEDSGEPSDTTACHVEEKDSGFVTYGSSSHATNIQETCGSQQSNGNQRVSHDTEMLEVDPTDTTCIDKDSDHSQDLGVGSTAHNGEGIGIARNDGESGGVGQVCAKLESDVGNLTYEEQIQYAIMLSMETTPHEETIETMDVKQHPPPPSEEIAEFTKQCIKDNRVRFIDTLDVRLFEQLLQPHLALVTQPHESKMDKARALLDRLALDPEEQNIIFINIICGLYPRLVKETTGETPTNSQSDVCMQRFCADIKKTVEEKGNVPTRGRKICLDTQCIDTEMRLVKEKEVPAKDENVGKGSTPDLKQKRMADLKTIQSQQEENDPTEELGDDSVLPEIYQGYLEGSMTKIETKDLLLDLKPGAILLLRGRAGIGKTTTAQKLAQKWRKGEWAQEYKVAFILNLRYLATLKYSMTLSELLTQYSVYNPTEAHPQFPLWMSKSSDRILIFLEGLDELSDLESMLLHPREIQANPDATARPIEWVINIILCNVLPSSCKVITSRPFTALKHLDCQRTVELLGLTRSAVKEFIKRNVPEERQMQVQQSLESNPHLLSVCGITFYCAALCQLLEAGVDLSDEQHLNTYTRITSFLVLETPYHQTAEVSQGPYTKAQGLADVLPPLARLAKYGLLQGNKTEKLTFNQADFLHAKIRSQEQKDMEKSGLISSLTIKDPRSKEHVQTQFLHLSLQEILTAAKILESDKVQIETTLKNMSHMGRLNMAELFLVGLALDTESEWVTALRGGVGFNKPEREELPDAANIVRSYCLDIVKDNSNQSDCLRGVQAAYESRDIELAKRMSQRLGQKEEVTFSSTSLTSIDVNALLFVWQHIENIRSIALTDVNLDDFSLGILQPFICDRKAIKEISLNGNQITDKGVAKLFNAELQNRITLLSLRGNRGITDDGVNCISKSLEEDTSLTVVNLEDTSITNNGLLSLMKAVCIRGKPVCVSVSKHLNKDLRRVLRKGGLVTEATTLNLRCSEIGKMGIWNLAVLLENKAHIMKLNLSRNQVDDNSTSRLAEALRENTTLEELNLSNNPITDVGLKELADVLTKNTDMNRLCLNLDKVEFVSSRTQSASTPLLQLGLDWNKTIVVSTSESKLQKNPVLELRQNSEAHSSDKGRKLTDSSGSDDEQSTNGMSDSNDFGKSETKFRSKRTLDGRSWPDTGVIPPKGSNDTSESKATMDSENSNSDGSLDLYATSTESATRLILLTYLEALYPSCRRIRTHVLSEDCESDSLQ